MKRKIVTGLAAALLAAAVSTAAVAATETYAAHLMPGAGITSSGHGEGTFTYDTATKHLKWSVTYEGLTGPALMAHIHGPADPGANAGVQVPFPSAASPMTGEATLTDAQAADLKAGKLYVNVHTAANRGGEVRGQIVAK